ncbi:uncharacterized protein [Typha angustifolia]|uniref:uncharacterized protein isoform X1 n=2 Tax=Typha angustifolia TaxID=59011 RepID=UPI003C2C5BB4
MILNSAVGGVAVILTTARFSPAVDWRRRMKRNNKSPFVVAFSNQSQTLQLRTQLDQLHAESELTRSKANSARMRLMRLSEAAENLKRRAATSVLLGKESEARELLVQKKKLMQALERSKNRIEVLDELSAKINEAISLKETELIKYVAMHPEIGREDPTQKIRFASAKCHSDEAADKPNDSAELGENSSLDLKNYSDNVAEKSKELEYGLSENSINSIDNNMISSLKGLSSYRDLLEHIDMQLRLVEADVDKFINSQLLTAESKQKKNIELQMLSEILKDILSIRERIASIKENITRY